MGEEGEYEEKNRRRKYMYTNEVISFIIPFISIHVTHVVGIVDVVITKACILKYYETSKTV